MAFGSSIINQADKQLQPRPKDVQQNAYPGRERWIQIVESTMPLKQSKMASLNRDYTQMNGHYYQQQQQQQQLNQLEYGFNPNNPNNDNFNSSLELNAKEISRKLIVVNAISLCINLILALVAFYFAFVNNSSSTSAFAADCVLDFISSAIVLWRYCGDDLSSVYRHAREQIACIYLGALFELSALAIIVKATSDMVYGEEPSDMIEDGAIAFDLVYLALAATLACSILTVFKCALYKTIRDNSILLDVINTLISTVFAMSIVMSQALINVNPSFWYLDPIISIVLALFMAAFGLQVIYQNFNILRPVYRSTTSSGSSLLRSFSIGNGHGTNGYQTINKSSPTFLANPQSVFSSGPTATLATQGTTAVGQFGANLNASIEFNRTNNNNAADINSNNNWQKSDYSTIAFI